MQTEMNIPNVLYYNLQFVYLNPLFECQKRFFKEVFKENSAFMYGLYSRAVSNQERVMMARVRYVYQLIYFNPILIGFKIRFLKWKCRQFQMTQSIPQLLPT